MSATSSDSAAASRGEHKGGALRRVQRTGSSSFSVTLPKWWIEAVGMRYGDTLRFQDLGGGRLELSLGIAPSHRREDTLTLATRNAAPHLLPRLVIGAYLAGKDQVTLRGNMTPEQRDDVKQAVSKLLGSSVVEDGQGRVVIQNFADPTQYDMSRLMDRLVRLLLLQVEECRRGALGKETLDRSQLTTLEDEVDKIYRLMVRQIVLACDDSEIAKSVGASSHRSHIMFRMVAKLLEDLGDHLFALGLILCPSEGERWEIPEEVSRELVARLERFQALFGRTMAAFERASAEEANLVLNDVHSDVSALERLAKELPPRVPSQPSSLAVQKAIVALQWITQMLHVVNEVTINRAVGLENIPRSDAPASDGPAARPIGV